MKFNKYGISIAYESPNMMSSIFASNAQLNVIMNMQRLEMYARLLPKRKKPITILNTYYSKTMSEIFSKATVLNNT